MFLLLLFFVFLHKTEVKHADRSSTGAGRCFPHRSPILCLCRGSMPVSNTLLGSEQKISALHRHMMPPINFPYTEINLILQSGGQKLQERDESGSWSPWPAFIFYFLVAYYLIFSLIIVQELSSSLSMYLLVEE